MTPQEDDGTDQHENADAKEYRKRVPTLWGFGVLGVGHVARFEILLCAGRGFTGINALRSPFTRGRMHGFQAQAAR